MTNATRNKPIEIRDNKFRKSRAHPPTAALSIADNETLEVKAPRHSDLFLFFFQGKHLGDELSDDVPSEFHDEYAPFGGNGSVRIKAGTTWTSGKPISGWPSGEKNSYPYLIYVQKKDRLAHGNSPPRIILL